MPLALTPDVHWSHGTQSADEKATPSAGVFHPVTVSQSVSFTLEWR